jgi:atypical dual specificity phosphatase
MKARLAARRMTRLVAAVLRLRQDPGTWIEPDRLLACSYPRTDAALAGLATRGIGVLVNLHERSHDPARLARFGLAEVHLPVPDFLPPTPAQITAGVAAIQQCLATGQGVAVHCRAGLGRTGTLLACYLVSQGADASSAIAQIRALRPGSVENSGQVAAIQAFARRKAI